MKESYGSSASPNLFRLRHAAKLSIFISAVAAVLFAVLIIWLLESMWGAGYSPVARSVIMSPGHVSLALFVCGLFLLSVVGIVIWLVLIYTSFSVAGPLYHFAKVLKEKDVAIPTGKIKIREDDSLEKEAELLSQGVASVNSYYQAVTESLQILEVCVDDFDQNKVKRLLANLTRLTRTVSLPDLPVDEGEADAEK